VKKCIFFLFAALLIQPVPAAISNPGLDLIKKSAQCTITIASTSIVNGAFWALLSKVHNSLEEKNNTFGYTAYNEKTMFKLASCATPLLILILPETYDQSTSELITTLAIAALSGYQLKKICNQLEHACTSPNTPVR